MEYNVSTLDHVSKLRPLQPRMFSTPVKLVTLGDPRKPREDRLLRRSPRVTSFTTPLEAVNICILWFDVQWCDTQCTCLRRFTGENTHAQEICSHTNVNETFKKSVEAYPW